MQMQGDMHSINARLEAAVTSDGSPNPAATASEPPATRRVSHPVLQARLPSL